MGYKAKSAVYDLKFTGEEFEGLEVSARSLPMKDMLQLQKIASRETNSYDDIIEMVKVFQAVLLKWNLEDENGEPVPTTVDGLLTQDLDFIMNIVAAWTETLAGVDKDLGKESTSGEISPEVSIPMETL